MTTKTDIATKEDLVVLKEDILDEMDKQKKDLLDEMDKKLDKTKNEIITAVAGVIHDGINPILDDHEERLKKIERRFPAVA
jgi:Mg2+ and Co2+ transporter CorA